MRPVHSSQPSSSTTGASVAFVIQPVLTAGRVFLTADPTTPIDAAHVAIVGDGKVHVTTGEPDAPSLTAYDPAEIDRIDFRSLDPAE